MKQRFSNVLHAHLSKKVALASLYRIHRLAQSVGNIIHRVTLGRQSQNISLSLAQGYAFFLFPLVAQCGIFKIATLTILLHDDMSRLIGSCQRYGAEGKPYSSVIRKENRSEVMMNQSALTAISKMKVVRDGIVEAPAHRRANGASPMHAFAYKGTMFFLWRGRKWHVFWLFFLRFRSWLLQLQRVVGVWERP